MDKIRFLLIFATFLSVHALAMDRINGHIRWLGCNAKDHQCYVGLVENTTICQTNTFMWQADTGAGQQIFQILDIARRDQSQRVDIHYQGCGTGSDGTEHAEIVYVGY